MYTLYRSPAAFYECLITVMITLPRTSTAKKKILYYPLVIHLLILRMLGWVLYFLIASKTGPNTSIVSTRNCLSLSIFKVFPIFTKKNLLKVSATFSVSDIILQSSLNIPLLVPSVLFEKICLTTLQKFLISAMWLTFKEPVLQIRYFQFVGQWAEGLKGILRCQVVQERCIFLLPRSTKKWWKLTLI